MPRWGRPPPGARLAGRRESWPPKHQSWNLDPRFEEVDDSGDDGFSGVQLDRAYAQKRYASDNARFDAREWPSGSSHSRRMADYYYEESPPHSDEEAYRDRAAWERRYGTHQIMIEQEDDLVERALERIARARALGKTSVKLSQAEMEALDRSERSSPPLPVAIPASTTAPKSKKPSPVKKSIEAKKLVAKKGEKSTETSPKIKPASSRPRGRSTASDRSAREPVTTDYPPLPSPEYSYDYRRGAAPAPSHHDSSLPASRKGSSASLRHSLPPTSSHAYQQPRYYTIADDHDRRPVSSRSFRPDAADPDWEASARPRSRLVNYPLDQLPNHSQTTRAPRFDPTDPRFGSPQRRGTPGPVDVRQYRYSPDQSEVMSYMVRKSSSEGTDGTDDGVQVEHGDRARYSTRTTRSAAAASKPSGASSTARTSTAKTVKRR